jgi:hypothetical protein
MFGIDDLGLMLGAAKMVPKAWEMIAGLFGKKAPETVLQAGELIDGIETEIQAGKVSPEQQIELKRMLFENDQVKARYEFEREKLRYDDQAGGREVIKTALMSSDPVVRQARPKMMMRLGNGAILYTFVMPIFVGICAVAGAKEKLLGIIVQIVLYLGLALWGAFTTSFTGYTLARSADKRVAGNSDLQTSPSRLLGVLSKLGHAIS